MMKTIEILFWIALAIVFYTYAGYGIFLYLLVRVKEALCKRTRIELPEELPEVTLLIAAYNEEAVIADKMRNCRALDYPGRPAENRLGDGRFERPHERIAGRISGSHCAVCTRTARQNSRTEPGSSTGHDTPGRFHRCEHDAGPGSDPRNHPALRRFEGRLRGRRKEGRTEP